ncbi:MAG: primase-helicase zinc-binding domain-containing protein, partial [Mariprofundaceae bacterium]
MLDGKHRPCPACGGKDRFRFDDKEGRGSHICSQCGAGDGFELVRKMFDYSGFKDAAHAVEGVLGIDCEPPTRESQEAYRRKLEAERASREKLDAETHRLAAIEAQRIWAGSKPAGNDHPYLQAKQVQAYGIRIDNGSLIIPVRIGGKITSIQRIGADGSKRLLKDGEVIGGYHSIDGDDADMSRIYIAEGYATAATVRDATGCPVAVAFNAGNLGKVAQAIHSKLPDIKIIIAGDNDESQTGETKGKAAAESVGGIFTMPPEPGDWNDYAAAHDLDAVRDEIGEPAQKPAKSMKIAVDRLAELSPLEYDKVRQTEAKAIGVRTSTLDAEVKAAREAAQDGQAMFAEVEPWPEQVSGGDLLNDIVSTFNRFIVTPTHVP